MWYRHTIEYYSALKKGILSSAVTWMNLEDITQGEISQSQGKYAGVHQCDVSKVFIPIEAESRTVVTQGWEEEGEMERS